MKERCRPIQILKYTGVMAASTMGAGFATGQEILQFFTAQGFWSIAGVGLMLVLVALLSASVALSAEQHKGDRGYHPYRFFAGELLGKGFQWFGCVMVILFFIVAVGGAGATIELCFGVPYWLGCTAISLLALATYLAGMRRMVDILGCIGPIAVTVIIFISVLAVVKFQHRLADVPDVLATANFITTADFWWLSALMYTASNLFFPILFMTGLVQNAPRPREATWGCVLGTATYSVGLGAVNCGMLAILGDLSGSPVPSLVLADAVAPVLGLLYSVLLIGLVYGSATTILFVAVGEIAPILKGRKRTTAVLVCLCSFTSGLFPFATLVNVVYTYMGYICIAMVIAILIKLPTLLKRAGHGHSCL